MNMVIEYLQQQFEMKVCEAKYFLGFEICRMPGGEIHLNQAGYVRKVLNNFGFESSNVVSTPMDSNTILMDVEQLKDLNFPYRQAVGSLIYLAVGTRPDISFVVGYVSRFLQNPSNSHVTAVKRIMRYLKGTIDYGILF